MEPLSNHAPRRHYDVFTYERDDESDQKLVTWFFFFFFGERDINESSIRAGATIVNTKCIHKMTPRIEVS